MLQKLPNFLKEFQNTLLCKFYTVTTKDPYPISILPRVKYLRTIDLDTLLSEMTCVIVRRSNLPADESFSPYTDTLREDAISPSDLPNLSMNLLGGNFKSNHIVFRQTGYGAKEWDGGPVHFESVKRFFERLKDDAGPIYFYLHSLHNKTFPYQRAKDPHTKSIINRLKLQPKESGKYEFFGSTKIAHTPNNLNYWHVELFLFDSDEKKIKDVDREWKENVVKMAYAQLITGTALPLKIEPSIKKIPRTCFHKK